MHWSQVFHTILSPNEYIVAISSLFKGHFKHPSGSPPEQMPQFLYSIQFNWNICSFQVEKLCPIVWFACWLFCKYSDHNANKSSHLIILFFPKDLLILEGGGAKGIPSRLPAEQEARGSAQSHYPETMTWAKIKNRRLNELNHPGAPHYPFENNNTHPTGRTWGFFLPFILANIFGC